MLIDGDLIKSGLHFNFTHLPTNGIITHEYSNSNDFFVSPISNRLRLF